MTNALAARITPTRAVLINIRIPLSLRSHRANLPVVDGTRKMTPARHVGSSACRNTPAR
jgi:hypothetical protein